MAVSRIEKLIAIIDTLDVDFGLGSNASNDKAAKDNVRLELIESNYQRVKAHRERKRALPQDRLKVFEILVLRFLSDESCRKMVNYQILFPLHTIYQLYK